MSVILDHVEHVYDADTELAHTALADLCLKIDDGEYIGLIGHTGSGKSTLIQHLNGLLRPTSGNIYFDGKDIWDREYDRRALRACVGLVFQYPEHQLFEETCLKDVSFGPKNLGKSDKEAELRAYECLKQVGLEEKYIYQSPFDLSGGQKRRVAIAGVLAMSPRVLILDEPTAGLDPSGRDDILELIDRLHSESGITVILVSHSMEDVADHVERILVMNKAHLIMDGEPREVFKRYRELEDIGLSAPEVTYVMRQLYEAGIDVDPEATTVREAADSIITWYRNA